MTIIKELIKAMTDMRFYEMRKTTNYALATGYHESNYDKSLVDEVNDMISEGWEPIGGVAAMTDGETTWLYQAMIRRG